MESVGIEFGDLRSHGALLDAVDAERYLTAQALLMWQDESHFCAKDGAPMTITSGGWTRVCTACGREEYPRTDPAIICLVHDGADRVLLARHAAWPARNFSTLAGFVEAGESLESCVAREIAEEVGLVVSDVATSEVSHGRFRVPSCSASMPSPILENRSSSVMVRSARLCGAPARR